MIPSKDSSWENKFRLTDGLRNFQKFGHVIFVYKKNKLCIYPVIYHLQYTLFWVVIYQIGLGRYARYHTLAITKRYCFQSGSPPQKFDDLLRQLASCETTSHSRPNTVLHLRFHFPDTTPPKTWFIRPKGSTYS